MAFVHWRKVIIELKSKSSREHVISLKLATGSIIDESALLMSILQLLPAHRQVNSSSLLVHLGEHPSFTNL